jgi:inorganic phosphate transporter, PiT family
MTFLYFLIALVLTFDFINGFHDSANSIATVVSTKVLSPIAAVGLAATFNFVAFLIFPLRVAKTIGANVIDTEIVTLPLIATSVIAAIIWNLLTWWWGLPSSSSHTLVGGLVGSAIVSSGFDAVIYAGVIKIAIFIIVAPVLGMLMSYIISVIVLHLVKNHSPLGIDRHFRRFQLVSASAFSLGHGGNDAQKSMGIIWVALYAVGKVPKESDPALWVVLSCHAAMALGTLFGGWRIVKTMGQKITKLKPFEGFCAETAGAFTLFLATHFGIPVSTTHTITGAIIGVGATKRASAVKWGVTKKIFWAWILTIPASAVIGGTLFFFLHSIL